MQAGIPARRDEGSMTRSQDDGVHAITLSALRNRFRDRFGKVPRVFKAPGRVNLIGEHTDYNDGFVMPAALHFATWVAIAERPDREVRIVSVNFREERTFSLAGAASPAHDWSDYPRGVLVELMRAGFEIPGADVMIWGDVPLGAGLSSSASIEVATAIAYLGIAGQTSCDLPRLCQRAENEFVGARCGIMDQFISAHGRSGHVLMLDCRSLSFDLIPVPTDVTMVICNTMVKHRLAGGEYNVRRAQCEEGTRILQGAFPAVRALRDVSPQDLESQRHNLSEVVYRRCHHVVTENARVVDTAMDLKRGDIAAVGRRMAESHSSLRDDYEVSCSELDLMVEIALQQPGLIGARMTGGGFGGCTVNLVRNELVEAFRSSVSGAYAAKTGVNAEIYVSPAADGAREVL